MTNYVAGLMFNKLGTEVALVEKKKFPPGADWSLTPYNAIGGKIEPNEFSYEAMLREFKEETGVSQPFWDKFLILEGSGWQVEFYKCFTDKVYNVRTMEEETIIVSSVTTILGAVVPNMKWILPLALDKSAIGVAIAKER
jgi:8-oxo-dGTP diphosphatase